MTTEYEPDMAVIRLVGDILDEFQRTQVHRSRPESRELLVRTLDGLMANGLDLEAHVAWMEAEREVRGREFQLSLLRYDSPNLPDEAILAHGFEAAGDDVLVDIIISPEGLDVMFRYVNHPDSVAARGEWFDAAKREG